MHLFDGGAKHRVDRIGVVRIFVWSGNKQVPAQEGIILMITSQIGLRRITCSRKLENHGRTDLHLRHFIKERGIKEVAHKIYTGGGFDV